VSPHNCMLCAVAANDVFCTSAAIRCKNWLVVTDCRLRLVISYMAFLPCTVISYVTIPYTVLTDVRTQLYRLSAHPLVFK